MRAMSNLSSDEAESMIGKTIARVEAEEYSLTLHFTDGSTLCVGGHCWEENALSVNYSEGIK